MSLNNKKSKEDIIAALSSNVSVVAHEERAIVPQIGPSDADIINDTEKDFEYARSHIKKLIDTSDDAISRLHELASDTEHPRAFEVLTTMIKNTADMNSSLLELIKNRKKLVSDTIGKQSTGNVGSITNNSIFVGTTTELQKFLKSRDEEEEEAIDI